MKRVAKSAACPPDFQDETNGRLRQYSIAFRYGGLLQAGNTASDFAHAAQPVTKVELQTGSALYTVLGPAVKH